MIVRLTPISYLPFLPANRTTITSTPPLISGQKCFSKTKSTCFCLPRYMAIVHPLRHRRSKTRTQTVLVLIWLISVFLAMPCILYSNLKTKRYDLNRLRHTDGGPGKTVKRNSSHNNFITNRCF